MLALPRQANGQVHMAFRRTGALGKGPSASADTMLKIQPAPFSTCAHAKTATVKFIPRIQGMDR